MLACFYLLCLSGCVPCCWSVRSERHLHVSSFIHHQHCAGLKVESVRDLGTGLDTSQPDGKATLPWTKGDKFISFALSGSSSLTLRASGTEPKLKYYLEVQGEDKRAAAKLAEQIEADVVATLLQPEKYGLTSSIS